jgi:ribosomal protein S6--L-glutamate ligase
MKNIIVVNGEMDWQEYFPSHTVHYRRIQQCSWLYHEGTLWVFDTSGGQRVDAVLWRVGAIKPHPSQRYALELIRMAGVPCVNPARVLLRGYDRLSMLNDLREAGLPVQTFSVALGERVLDLLHPDFPAVLKVGNFHAGFGKMRVEDEEQWADAKDMTFITEDYATLEPYIDYVRDIRCLTVGEQVWAMTRRGVSWKANNQTQEYKIIPVPPQLDDYTRRAMNHLQADVLALDFLERHDGSYVLLESNDIPGFSGFPTTVREAVSARLLTQFKESDKSESPPL